MCLFSNCISFFSNPTLYAKIFSVIQPRLFQIEIMAEKSEKEQSSAGEDETRKKGEEVESRVTGNELGQGGVVEEGE